MIEAYKEVYKYEDLQDLVVKTYHGNLFGAVKL